MHILSERRSKNPLGEEIWMMGEGRKWVMGERICSKYNVDLQDKNVLKSK